jgi:hypothetical protein
VRNPYLKLDTGSIARFVTHVDWSPLLFSQDHPFNDFDASEPTFASVVLKLRKNSFLNLGVMNYLLQVLARNSQFLGHSLESRFSRLNDSNRLALGRICVYTDVRNYWCCTVDRFELNAVSKAFAELN